MIAVLALLLLTTVWLGVRGALAYKHLRNAQSAASNLAAALIDGTGDTRSILSAAAENAKAARELTSDPVWVVAEQTPWIGPQLSAFHAVATATDHMLGESLLPLLTNVEASSIESLKPANGRFDLSAIAKISDPLNAASAAAEDSLSKVSDIDRTPLLGMVGRAVDEAEEAFSQLTTSLTTLSRTTQLLPGMLGQDADRNYLVLIQSNAEWRSLGGITGTALLLHTSNGTISLVKSDAASSLSKGLESQAVDLPTEVTQLYGTQPGRFFQNLTQIPDFTRDGPLAREMYRRVTGTEVDGVIALDPVALSYLIQATGPIALDDGEVLTAGNTAEVLLNGAYLRYTDYATQDEFFTKAASSIFSAFLSGKGATTATFSALARAADQRRILIWSARPSEQSQISGTAVAGELPTTDDKIARFGVFLNDATGSKMSYYVKPQIKLAWQQCDLNAQGVRQVLELELSLTNTAPADAEISLPRLVTGGGTFGVAPGTAAVVVNFFLPEGFEVLSSGASNGASYKEDAFDGRKVITYGLNLKPLDEESMTVRVQRVGGPPEAQALMTPTADSALNPTTSASCTHSDMPELR